MASTIAQNMAPRKGHRMAAKPRLTPVNNKRKVRWVALEERISRHQEQSGTDGMREPNAQSYLDAAMRDRSAGLHAACFPVQGKCPCAKRLVCGLMEDRWRRQRLSVAQCPALQQALPQPQSHPPIGTAVSREVLQPTNAFFRKADVSEA